MCAWRIWKKIILFSGFKNPYKKIRETRKLESIHEKHFVEWKNEDRKPHKSSSLRRLEFMPRNFVPLPPPSPPTIIIIHTCVYQLTKAEKWMPGRVWRCIYIYVKVHGDIYFALYIKQVSLWKFNLQYTRRCLCIFLIPFVSRDVCRHVVVGPVGKMVARPNACNSNGQWWIWKFTRKALTGRVGGGWGLVRA